MITKVFEQYTYTELQKVKKTIQVTEQEDYYDEVIRTERVYEPPTGVTNCLHCGVRLRETMWVYSGSNGKYLCPDCWYRRTSSSQKEKYRQQAQRMSNGGYSYNNVTDKVLKTRTINKNKEIETEEPVTRSGLKLVWPVDMNYNDKSVIFNQPIYIFDKDNNTYSLAPQKYFKDDEISNDQIWFNTSSYTDAIKKIKGKNPKTIIERVKNFSLGTIPYNEVIVDEKQVLEEFVDVVGFYPNVPAFIQGHPLNMYNNKRKNIVNIDKVVTIYCNLAIDSKCDFGHYKNRGVILYSLIEYLKNADFKVNLRLLDATFIDGETIIQEFEPQLYKNIDFKNPDINNLNSEQEIKLEDLYKILTSLSFYRVLLLENKAQIVKNNNLKEKWFNGFGYCLKNIDLRKILKIDENTIVVGNPYEHGINGLFLDDDFINFAKSLGIFSDIEESYNATDDKLKKEYSVEKVIKIREITKLIHVTAKENIESIKKLGILPKTILEKQNITFHQNDFQRLDKHPEAICLSVSEPNEFLFKEFSKRNPHTEYQVLEIDPRILYEINHKNENVKRIYSDYNAASHFSKISENNLEVIFQDRIRRKSKVHTRDGLQLYQPTSAQAEILFFGEIPSKYILKIYSHDFKVENKDSRKEKTRTISEICREMGGYTAQEMHNKLCELGYLEIIYTDNKKFYIPTKKGKDIGISTETRKSKTEIYEVNIYNENAVKIIKELV